MNDDLYKGIKLNLGLCEDVFMQLQPSILKLAEISEALNNSIMPAVQAYNQLNTDAICRMVESMRPALEVYSGFEQMRSIADSARILSESFSPISQQIMAIQENMPDFSRLNDALQQVIPDSINYSLLALNLQNALSTWKFEDIRIYEDEFEDVPEELTEAVKAVCGGKASPEQVNGYAQKWSRIKRIVSTIFIYILFNLILPSFYEYKVAPVYETIEKIILFQNKEKTVGDGEIGKNTELEVWSDDLNQDYIEICYQYKGETIAGYIKRADLEKNTKKISEGINIDEVIFVSYCTDLMAERWNIEASEAYAKLNDETDMVNTFLVCNYDALSKMEDNDMVEEILKEYDRRKR